MAMLSENTNINIDIENLDVWVLAGQSNMQGCGLLRDATLCDASASDERVFNFTMAGQWQIATEPLHRMWESYTPVHPDFLRGGVPSEEGGITNEEFAEQERKNGVAGAGLGIPFGVAMAEATGKPIGLISAAHGGTSLENWNEAHKELGGKSLYGSMLDRIQKAGGKLRGVLWYQGESDGTPGLDTTYAERFESWIAALRSDTNQPNLPVIVVQLGRVVQSAADKNAGWQGKSWDIIREAQRTLPDNVANTGVVSAIDLGICDTIHIDTPGLIRLGKRMAHVALGIQSGSTPASPHLAKIEKGTDQPNGFGVARVFCDGVTGGWQPKTHLSGFTIRDAQGNPHPTSILIEANVDARDPKIINVIVHPSPDETMFLAYGLGLSPICNVVDEADQPLPTFAPQPMA